MVKILLNHKKDQLLVWVDNNKKITFEYVLKRAIKDCKIAQDEKGLTTHVMKSLQRNGFKVLYLNELEARKI